MLEGELVKLVAVEREHLPTFKRFFNDYELVRLLAPYGIWPLSAEDEQEWYERQRKDESSLSCAILTRAEGRLIGSCGFTNLDRRNRAAEVGIAIGDPAYWGKGYGTEALRLLVGHGFAELNLHRIALRVYDFNVRAIRSYEKLGFQHEGRLRQALFREGRYHDVLVMGLLAEEWRQMGDRGRAGAARADAGGGRG